MSLHCYVIPHSVVSTASRLFRAVSPARTAPQGVRHAVVHHAAKPAVRLPAAAGPNGCAAPVQALRALRSLAGLPAAGLLAGGMALGAGGAGLSQLSGAGAPATEIGSGSGYGGGFGGGSGSAGDSRDLASGTASTVDGSSAATGTGSVQSGSTTLGGVPAVARFRQLRAAAPQLTSTTATQLAQSDSIQGPVTISDDTTVTTADRVSVPEPIGMAWAGFLLVGGAVVWSRHRRVNS